MIDFSSLRFEDPLALGLIGAVVLAGVVAALRVRRPSGGLLFPGLSLLPATSQTLRTRFGWIVLPLRVLALVCLAFALARPQVVHAQAEAVAEGIDIVLVLDNSGSMSERGLGGAAKIDALKRVVDKFLGGLTNDRVGIVIFAGDALVLGPPTLDHAASQKLVAPLEAGALSGGTAIGTALGTGVNLLRDSDAKSKVVVLLTDGENNSGDIAPLDAAHIAQLLGVRVYTIGVVSDTADAATTTGSVDEQVMRQMSGMTSGRYYRVTDENALAEVYREIQQLEKSRVGVREFVEYEDLYPAAVALGAVLLFVELALTNTVFRRSP